MLSQREALLGNCHIASNLGRTIVFEGIVGGGIYRVLDVYAKALVGHEVWVGQQDGPVAFRIVALQHRQTAVGLVCTSLSGVEQPQVIPRLVITLIVSILTGQS